MAADNTDRNVGYAHGKITDYKPPVWAQHLHITPTHRVQLAQLGTPIHKWELPGVPSDVELYIKRDDMTGGDITGNKIRKLEFLLADAIQKGCKHVITTACINSNYCRAVALAATQLGLKVHLLLKGNATDAKEVGCYGNVLLMRMCGAEMYIIPKDSDYEKAVKPRMEELCAKIKRETAENSYLLPTGGSNSLGIYGYLNAYQEMIDQNVLENFDDIVFACGTGGTGEGLAIANYLNGSKLKIHGILVSRTKEYCYTHFNQTLEELGLSGVNAEDLIDYISGHVGMGYGLSTQEEIDFLVSTSTSSGIVLDPVYTGKAAKGLVQELNHNGQRFKGKRILFIHTGGVFMLYDGRMAPTLTAHGTETNKVYMWDKIEKPPFYNQLKEPDS